MDGDILRPGWPCFKFQKLVLSGEIPRVVLESPETDRGLYVLLVCCVVGVILWAVPRWTAGWFISPSELILVLFL